jgi:hypothetical protein
VRFERPQECSADSKQYTGLTNPIGYYTKKRYSDYLDDTCPASPGPTPEQMASVASILGDGVIGYSNEIS